MANNMNRREFLETSGKAALGVGLGLTVANALATPSYAQKKTISANDKIRVGCIGLGGMGTGNMHEFMNHQDVEIVAVCDVDSNHLNSAADAVEKKYGRKPLAVKDFRKLLENKDIDAVMIATPDHWHALPFIYACEAGMDIFCEKPISHNLVEAQAMLGAAKKNNTVVQINTWQRSVSHFQDALEFVHSGALGKIAICRAWICGGAGLGKNPIKDPPANLDWDFYCGPAAKVPYHDMIHPDEWRWYYNFGTGMSGDWGVHMIDTVLLGMNVWDPLEVSSYGGKLRCAQDDDRTTPDTQLTLYKFPDFVLHWEVHVSDEGLDGGRRHGAEFIGENGKLIVDRQGIIWKPYGGDRPGPEKKNEGKDHMGNFLANMRSRGKCRSDIESMYRTTAICHLANMSYLSGGSIKWDGKKGVAIDNKKAMGTQSYRREYRKPWTLPVYKDWNV